MYFFLLKKKLNHLLYFVTLPSMVIKVFNIVDWCRMLKECVCFTQSLLSQFCRLTIIWLIRWMWDWYDGVYLLMALIYMFFWKYLELYINTSLFISASYQDFLNDTLNNTLNNTCQSKHINALCNPKGKKNNNTSDIKIPSIDPSVYLMPAIRWIHQLAWTVQPFCSHKAICCRKCCRASSSFWSCCNALRR